MQYTKREKLTVVEVKNDMNTISFDMLATAIVERPSNMIYVEKEGKLYGIISMGDIARADKKGEEYVSINKNFIRITSKEYMRARKLFYERENVNAIPVVSGDNVLLGDYERWNDLKVEHKFGGAEVVRGFCKSIFLVRPCGIFKEKVRVFKQFREYLSSMGVVVKEIEHEEVVNYADAEEWILFTDEDEWRAIDTLIRYILHKDFFKGRLGTYKSFMQEMRYETIEEYLNDIKTQGVSVLNLVSRWNTYCHEFNKGIYDKFAAFGKRVSDKAPSALYKDFLDELYTVEYAEHIMHLPFSIETGSHNGKLKDYRGEFYNVINGERYTEGQPEEYQRTIYFVGPCFIYGHYVEDRNTIESLLQRRLNNTKKGIRVVNCGSVYSKQPELELARIKEIPLKEKDILILYADNRSFRGIRELNLMDILQAHNANVNWVINCETHCNHKINALYADAIYDVLKPVMTEEFDKQGEQIKQDPDFVKTIYIDQYFAEFNPIEYRKIGAIVMNCNPFTYGHRYLIEQALKVVEFLIIFVVQEDKSLFSFEERFTMVCEGVKDLEHVMAVPSGPFILSKTTFPEYFIKEADADILRNVENDVTLFAEKIAPHLNIRYRFVGEEPEDVVTNEYNLAMKRILPQNGIELIEIPRKEWNRRYISASSVRKCLEDNDMKKLCQLVPESTRRVLFTENC